MIKKILPIFIFLMLAATMLASSFMGFHAATVSGYNAMVLTTDGGGSITDEFELGTRVYFFLHVEDNLQNPLTSSIYLYIYDDNDDVIEYKYINLDNNGNGSGYFDLDSSYTTGTYRLSVKTSAYGEEYGSDYITVTIPQYYAKVSTYNDDPDYNGELTDVFNVGQTVYYKIIVTDESDRPLRYMNIDVYLCDPEDDILDAESIYLSSQGSGSDYFRTYNNYLQGTYTIKVLIYDVLIGSHEFTLKIPKYIGTISTWDLYPIYGGNEKNTFNKDDRVYYLIHIENEDGEPYYSPYGNYVLTNLTYDGETVASDTVSFNYEGNGTDYFRLSNIDEIEFGKYTIEVRLPGSGTLICSHDFYVIDFELDIDKPLYAPGESVRISISVVPSNIISNLNIEIINYTTQKPLKIWQNVQLDENGELYLEYKIPDSIADGNYNVTVRDSSNNKIDQVTFYIKLLNLLIYPDQMVYLPGDKISVYYSLTSQKDGSGMESANYNWKLMYSDKEPLKGNFPSTRSLGTIEISLPKEMEKGPATIEVTATVSDGTHSATATIMVFIGALEVSIQTDSDEYEPGGFVIISITVNSYFSLYDYELSGRSGMDMTTRSRQASYYSHLSPLREAAITLNFYGNDPQTGKFEKMNEYSKTGLKTDLKGECEHIIMLSGKLKKGSYKIEAVVSKSGVEISNEENTASKIIQVVESISELALELQFDKQYYQPGDTVTVSYSVVYMDKGIGVLNPIIDYSAYFETGTYDDRIYIAVGRFKSQSFEGTFDFKISNNFDGEFYLVVTATNETGKATSKFEEITVNYAVLLLNVNKPQFNSGDNILVNYRLNRYSGLIDFYYKVIYFGMGTGGYCVLYEGHSKSESPTNSFNFTVPNIGSAEYYQILVYAIDSQRHYTENNLEIYKKSNYLMSIKLDKERFEKGDTIKIDYKIIPQGSARIPEHVRFEFGIIGSNAGRYESDQPEGRFTYKIPEDVDTGNVMFTIYGEIPFEDQSSDLISFQSIEIIDTTDDANGFENDFLRKSGMSVIDIILIILIISILISLLVMRIKTSPGTTRGKKKVEDKTAPKKLSWKEKRLLKQQAKQAQKNEQAKQAFAKELGVPIQTNQTMISPGAGIPQTQAIQQTPYTQPVPQPTPQQASYPQSQMQRTNQIQQQIYRGQPQGYNMQQSSQGPQQEQRYYSPQPTYSPPQNQGVNMSNQYEQALGWGNETNIPPEHPVRPMVRPQQQAQYNQYQAQDYNKFQYYPPQKPRNVYDQ